MYRTVDGTENDLVLCPPAEKGRRFDVLYEHCRNLDSWFWTGTNDEFIRNAGKVICRHYRSVKRLARDAAGRTAAKLHLR